MSKAEEGFMHTAARVGLSLLFGLAPLTGLSGQPGDKPQYGSWGFDLSGEDTSVKPGDDFFRYANGHWLAAPPNLPGKPGGRLPLEMTARPEARLHEMMEAAAAKAPHRPAD